MVGPENKGYGIPTYVAVLGRGTSVFRSLEDHSLIETIGRYRIDPGCEPRYRQRPRMSVRTSGNTQQNFHTPIGIYGTYTNPSQGLPYGDPIGEGMRPKCYRSDRANISTHVLMDHCTRALGIKRCSLSRRRGRAPIPKAERCRL